MKRREIIKNLFVSAAASKAILGQSYGVGKPGGDYLENTTNSFQSKWHLLPNMPGISEDCRVLSID